MIKNIFRPTVKGDITKMAAVETRASVPLQRSTIKQQPMNKESLGELYSPFRKFKQHSER